MPRHLRSYSWSRRVRRRAAKAERLFGESTSEFEVGSAEEARYLRAARQARLDPARARTFEHLQVEPEELTTLPFIYLWPDSVEDLEISFESKAKCACRKGQEQTTKLAFSFRGAPQRDLMRTREGFCIVSWRARALLEAAEARGIYFVPCLDSDEAVPDEHRVLEKSVPGPSSDHRFHQLFVERTVVPTAKPRTFREFGSPCEVCGAARTMIALYPVFPWADLQGADFIAYDSVFADGALRHFGGSAFIVSTRMAEFMGREGFRGWCTRHPGPHRFSGVFLDVASVLGSWQFTPVPPLAIAGLERAPTPRHGSTSARSPVRSIGDARAEHGAAFEELASLGLPTTAAALEQHSRASIRLTTAPVFDDEIPLGGSKLGGDPDLPADVAWPADARGMALTFVAQYDLGALNTFDLEGCMPGEGLLSIFYEVAGQPWGMDPRERGRWRVLWNDLPSDHLARRRPPAGAAAETSLSPRRFIPRVELTLPPDTGMLWQREFPGPHEMPDGLFEAWSAWMDRHFDAPEDGKAHRLLGFPDTIQGEMHLECAVMERRLAGDTGYREPTDPDEALLAAAAQWQLLAQIDSDEVLWGDAGRIYLWIKADDLEARRFDSVWLILQCY